jgi:hydrogenase-4 component F
MSPLLAMAPCPLAIVATALLIRHPGIVSRISASLMWLQMGLALHFWWPVLNASTPSAAPAGGFATDRAAGFFVLLTTLVVTAALTHAVGFFDREMLLAYPPAPGHISQFYAFLALFVLAMYAVVSADNLGYLWIGMEATTLLSAPLVYYHRSRTSLEATWKYVIVCSVGIAFAFLGTAMFYAASQQTSGLGEGSLSIATLTAHARQLPAGLMRLGFVFLLLGYGTKAGLFPLHNWLPDAHSEAPAPASAILSGALLNCALVALWRVSALMTAAGQQPLVHNTLLPMAVVTVLVASLLLLKPHDIKRLLAYSSMENVGLMAAAIGIGSTSGFALQSLNHSLVKAALFLVAGNLLQQIDSQKARGIRGLLAAQPAHAVLLLLLLAAVAGTPPFGSFLSEWHILTLAADAHYAVVVATLVVALAIAFIALSIQAGDMVFGPATKPAVAGAVSLLLVPALMLAMTLGLGIALTPALVAIAGGLGR